MRIDVHTHAFHPKVAEKVVAQLQEHYGVVPSGTAMLEHLLSRVRAAGLDKAVVLNAATAPAQVIPANNWLINLKQNYPQLIPFGTLHPGFDRIEAELDRLERNGIKGLKFHPEFQDFRMDDSEFLDLLEATRNRFIVLFHVGDTLPPEENPSCPFKMRRIVDRFPDMTVIAAHLGGYQHWKWSAQALAGSSAYLDTSSSLAFVDDETLHAIVDNHPRERLLFGSDYPLFDPVEEVVRLQQRLGLSDEEFETLLGNAAKLFPEEG